MGRQQPAAFVGRTSEFARLAAARAEAAAGQPGAVVVAGEAGVGKSRLVAEFVAAGRAAECTVLTGACIPISGGGLPYGPLVQVLEELSDEIGPAAIGDLLGPAAADLAPVLPELADGQVADAKADRFAPGRLFDAVRRLLGRLGDRQPVVVVVEDLHWADQSTLDLLAVLLRTLRRERALVVITVRTDEVPAEVLTVLAELHRSRVASRLELGRLDRQETAALLSSQAGAAPPAAVVDRIFALSEGNPFFAEELLDAGAATTAIGLPDRLRGLLLARVDRLTPEARDVLGVCAVAGSRVEHRLLAAVCLRPEQRLLDALREATEARLLVTDATHTAYAFRNALAREACYAELLPGERLRLHAAVARELVADPKLSAGEGAAAAAELAHHWHAAGSWPEALTASVMAGRAAAAVYAYADAQLQLERALRLWPDVPNAAERTGVDRVELVQEAAEAARWAGDPARAVELAREAVAALTSGVDLSDPVRLAALHERLGRYLWESGDTRAAAAAYDDAAGLLASQPPSRLTARVLAAQASALALAGRYQASRIRCEEAITVARAAGARAEEGWAQGTLGVDLAMTGDAEAGLTALAAARRLAEEAGTVEDVFRAAANSAFVLESAGRLEEALDVALAGVQVARDHRVELTGGSVLLTNAVSLLVQLGRWSEAEALAREVLDRGMPAGLAVFLRLSCAEVDIARGRFASAAAELAQIRATAATIDEPQLAGPLYGAVAELALWQGDYEQARAAVTEGLQAISTGEDDQLAIQLCAVGIRAEGDDALTAGPGRGSGDARRQAGRAEELASTAATLIEKLLLRGTALPQARAAALQCEAELRRVTGEPAADGWAAVVGAWDGLGRPHPSAYARWREAEALLAAKGGRRAAAALQDAHGRATTLGAEPLRAEIEALARRARVELAADAPVTTPPPGNAAAAQFRLTSRELEVLGHLVDGATNRQIARAMFITEKTASVHVSNIMAKVGAANRGEAAAIAHRLRLVRSDGG